jgi:serine/threonine protein kinase
MSNEAQPPLQKGTPIGAYVIDKLLGQGGMARTYRAIDQRVQGGGHLVALKIALNTDAQSRERVKREAEVMSKCHYVQNIPRLYVSDEYQGMPYIVMELLQGHDLKRELARLPGRRMPVQRAVDITAIAAKALHACHREGFVHRDVKPDNIFLAKTGSGESYYLIDFGITRSHAGSDVTEIGSIVGSTAYMGPEHAKSALVDERSDQFSLAATLYECIAGRLPWTTTEVDRDGKPLLDKNGRPVWKRFPQHYHDLMDGKVTPLKALVPDVPDELAEIIHRALDVDPQKRFSSILDHGFGQALSKFASPLVRATIAHDIDHRGPLPQVSGPVPTRKPAAFSSAHTVIDEVHTIATGVEDWQPSVPPTADPPVAEPAQQPVFAAGNTKQFENTMPATPSAKRKQRQPRRADDREASHRAKRRAVVMLAAGGLAAALIGAVVVGAVLRHHRTDDDLLPPSSAVRAPTPPASSGTSRPTPPAPPAPVPAVPSVAEKPTVNPSPPPPSTPPEATTDPSAAAAPAPADAAGTKPAGPDTGAPTKQRRRRARVRWTPAGIPILPND